jgi:hypothetical protein
MPFKKQLTQLSALDKARQTVSDGTISCAVLSREKLSDFTHIGLRSLWGFPGGLGVWVSCGYLGLCLGVGEIDVGVGELLVDDLGVAAELGELGAVHLLYLHG